jgi:hypothetical protein
VHPLSELLGWRAVILTLWWFALDVHDANGQGHSLLARETCGSARRHLGKGTIVAQSHGEDIV